MSKSRKHCRIKCGQTAPLWCTAYICITIEGSRCIGTDEAPIDAHSLVVKEAQPRPYRLLSEFEDPKTPLCCASCKKANRTVAWCRERMAHRYVPWNTAFVELRSAEDSVGECKAGEGARAGNIDADKSNTTRAFLCMVSANQNAMEPLERDAEYELLRPELFGRAPTVVSKVPSKNTAGGQTGMKTRKRRPKDTRQNNQSITSPKESKRLREEANAAIQNANLQARAGINAQYLRQGFMQWQHQQQQMSKIPQKQQQQEDDGNNLTKQSEKRRKTINDGIIDDGNVDSVGTGKIADDDKAKEDMPLDETALSVENPEEDGELLEFLDASFDG